MVILTKAQRKALFRLYQRKRPGVITPFKDEYGPRPSGLYKSFRRQAQSMIGGGGCVLIPLWGMWIGIETDGYTHS